MEADDLEDGMRTIIVTYTYRHMVQKAKQVTEIIVAGKVDNDFSLAAIVQHLRRQLLPVGYEPYHGDLDSERGHFLQKCDNGPASSQEWQQVGCPVQHHTHDFDRGGKPPP